MIAIGLFLFLGLLFGFSTSLALICSAYLKPKVANGDWVQFLQFWQGVAGIIAMITISIGGGRYLPLGIVIAPVLSTGAVLLVVAEALGGRRRAALIDLGLLSLAPLIGYPLIAAFAN